MSILGYINDNSHAIERVHFGILIGAMFTRKDILFNRERIQEVKLMKKNELLQFIEAQGMNVENRSQTLDTMIEHGEIFGNE
jgi:predicted NUDIX family phosphoesterase